MEQVSFNYRPGIHDFLRSRVLGQQEATDMVADAVERAMFGYFKAGAPIANFMFLGSTGVGKTETALSVAEFCGRGMRMITLFAWTWLSTNRAILRLS